MDNITHTLIGVAASKALLQKRVGRGATLILALASNLPDIDALFGFFTDLPDFAYRRMLTHSVVGFPLLALAAAGVFRLFYKHIPFKVIFALTFGAMAVHVFFDLANSYGVVLFYPLSLRRFELGWIYIIDVMLWFFLAAPLVLSLLKHPAADLERLYKVSLRCVVLYVAFCGISRWFSERALRQWIDNENLTVSSVALYPEALGAHRFRGALKLDGRYWVGLVNSFTGRVGPLQEIPTAEADPEVSLVRTHPMAQKLEWFFSSPVWKKNGPGHWSLFDLRFGSIVLNWRYSPYTFQFRLNGEHVTFEGRKSS